MRHSRESEPHAGVSVVPALPVGDPHVGPQVSRPAEHLEAHGALVFVPVRSVHQHVPPEVALRREDALAHAAHRALVHERAPL